MTVMPPITGTLIVGTLLLAGCSPQPTLCPCPSIPALAASFQYSIYQVSDRFNLAILPDGTLRCWGSACPPRPAGIGNVVAVSAGYSHALTLHADGSVRQYKGHGDNPRNLPSPPASVSTGVTAIAAGSHHNIALRQDGTVVVWAVPANANLAVPAEAQNGVVAIAAGPGYSLAVRSDGRVVQWGGTLPPVPMEAQSNVVAVAAGLGHSLALTRSGRVIQWGSLPEPVPPAAQSDVVAIAAGLIHSLALRSDGTVVAWGKTLSAGCRQGRLFMECGEEPARGFPDPTIQTIADSRPILVPASPWPCRPGLPGLGPRVRAIAAGGYRSLALLNDGTVVGWGDPIPYPLPAPPGGMRSDPPVPSDLVGPRCVTTLQGVRVALAAIPAVHMGDSISLPVDIDRETGSTVPVTLGLPDAANNEFVARFVYPEGQVLATRAARVALELQVLEFPLPPRSVIPVRRTLRLVARSGDVLVESTFSIDIKPPLRLQPTP